MRLDKDMILARPGHNDKYNENVSWQELKRSFTLYKRIPMIVAGGDHYGPIDPRNAIGFIDAKIDEEAQIIRGEPIFYEERFEEIPAEIQRRLLHKEFIPVSLGYEPFKDLRKIDHVAIGVESPVFKDIGFNAESKFRYEETDGINKQEPEPEPEESISEVKAEAGPMPSVTMSGEQFVQFIEAIKALAPAPPQEVSMEEATEREDTQEAPTAEPESPQPKPEVVPERVIPRDTSTRAPEGLFVDEGGRRKVSWRVAGSEEDYRK